MKYLLGFLIVFVIADGLITNFLINNGLAREANPFLQPLVGDIGFIILKAAGVLVAAVILWDIYRKYPTLALVSTWCFVVFYGAIVIWNLSLTTIS